MNANDEDRSVDPPIKAIVIGAVFIIVGKYLMDIGKDCCQFLNLSTPGQMFVAGGILIILLILVLILTPLAEFILSLLLSRNNPEAVTY
jgi:hypothetical protein